MITTI